MKKLPALLALVVLSSCVAETVERRRPRKGPIKEVAFVDPGGGTIRYSVEGWRWFVAGRRRDALRRMRSNCGKQLQPQILDEYQRQDADIAYSGEDITTNLDKGMDHFKIAPFHHIVYECRPRGGVVEPPAVSTAVPRSILVIPPVAEVSTATVHSPAADISTATAVEMPAVSTATVPQEPTP